MDLSKHISCSGPPKHTSLASRRNAALSRYILPAIQASAGASEQLGSFWRDHDIKLHMEEGRRTEWDSTRLVNVGCDYLKDLRVGTLVSSGGSPSRSVVRWSGGLSIAISWSTISRPTSVAVPMGFGFDRAGLTVSYVDEASDSVGNHLGVNHKHTDRIKCWGSWANPN